MYRKGLQGWLKHWDFMVLDLLCLQAAFALAYIARNGWQNPYADYTYLGIGILSVLADLVVILFFEPFKNILKRGKYRECGETLKHVCLVLLVVTFCLFSTHEGEKYSRMIFYLFGVFYAVFSLMARLLWKRFLRNRPMGEGKRSLFLITAASTVEQTVKDIKNSGYGMFHIAGLAVVDKDLRGSEICGVKVSACREDIVEGLKGEWVDEVFINLPLEEAYPEKLVNDLAEMGVVIHINLLRMSELSGQKQFVERIGGNTVLTTSLNCATARQTALKRMMDIAGGFLGCIATGILCIFIGPLIYLKSPGPIFFTQERVGKNGKRFKMYKFRSMYLDAEERKAELIRENHMEDQVMFKLEYDPRIIGTKKLPDGRIKKGIGNYIRDWSLDEFPQFFNVLKGDMSLVGTRPPTVDEWERYELHHRGRLAVKPGITGMWQVSGRSNITDFDEVVKLDKKYIREWSMELDLKILCRTVGVVLRRYGAM